MDHFIEIKLFQVKEEKIEEFETFVKMAKPLMLSQTGAISINFMKRFYTIDKVEPGNPPRELSKIVKCVKYYSIWEFNTKENYGLAIRWFFEEYMKSLQKLLIAPFDISLGYSL